MLKRKLSSPDIAICRPDQTSVDVPAEVAWVTDELHKDGHDAVTLPKSAVLVFAYNLLCSKLDKPQPLQKIEPRKATIMRPNKSLVDELDERIDALKKSIDQLKLEMRDCVIAKSALKASAIATATPTATERADADISEAFDLSLDRVAQFENYVLRLLERHPKTAYTTKQIRESYSLGATKSACFNRIQRMARSNKILFVDGLVKYKSPIPTTS